MYEIKGCKINITIALTTATVLIHNTYCNTGKSTRKLEHVTGVSPNNLI